jgi:hypothetical protein
MFCSSSNGPTRHSSGLPTAAAEFQRWAEKLKQQLKLYLILFVVACAVGGCLALESYLVFVNSNGWEGILKYQSWKYVIGVSLLVWLCCGGKHAPIVSAGALLAWSMPMLGLGLAAAFVAPGMAAILLALSAAPFLSAIALLRSRTIKAHTGWGKSAQQGIQPGGSAG